MEKKKSWLARHKVLTVIGVLLVIGIIGAASNSTSPPASTNTAENQQPTESAAPEKVKISLSDFYDKIQNDMTKESVTTLSEREPQNCFESQNQYAGKTEMCNLGEFGGGTIAVTFTNDKVSSKSKYNFERCTVG